MKVLALTRYARSGASSRARFYQYVPSLSTFGIDVAIAPLFSDDYVAELQQGRRRRNEIVSGYFSRISALRAASSYDLLWIEKDPLPWMPAVLEQSLMKSGTRYVLDYDDAVFHTYDMHGSALVRGLLGRKHAAIMRAASAVAVGNNYLARYASNAGARNIEVLPTTVDTDRYTVSERALGRRPVIGWIGQRSTARFLQALAPVFEEVSESGADVLAIGVDAECCPPKVRCSAWSEQTEVTSIQQFDVGIMPLLDGPFERGKCGYKLIQYMACGLPVVASPVGVNTEIVEHGVNGFLAHTPREWSLALHALSRDPELRHRMGIAGRSKVEKMYSLSSAVPRLADLLLSAADARGHGPMHSCKRNH